MRPYGPHARLGGISSICFLALMERATVRLLRGGALVSALEGGVLGGPGLPWQRQRGLFLTGLGWEGGVCPVPVPDPRFPPSARSVPRPVTARRPRP